jgi:biotin carboxyl carrier protein
MKRKFRVTIEGESYEVEVEEMEAMEKAEVKEPTSVKEKPPAKAEAPPVTPKAETPPVPSKAEAPPVPPKASPSPAVRPPTVQAGVEMVTSPMPGTIVSVNVKVGDSVKAGDILLVLESMKIQNEIPSPKDGKIKEVLVAEGKYVKRREPLVAIEG